MNAKGLLTVPALLLFLAAPLVPIAASADDLPSYARPVQQTRPNSDETITGQIASIDGTYNISVRDDRGFIDNVSLHDGTIINPTGLTLAAGMTVTVTGHNAGQTFDAVQIDTPYTYDGPPPVPVYYGDGAWYPGYAYGYGPSFSLFIGTGYALVQQPWCGHWYAGSWGGGYHGYTTSYRGAAPWQRFTEGQRYGAPGANGSRAPLPTAYNATRPNGSAPGSSNRPYAPLPSGYRSGGSSSPGSYGGYHSAPSYRSAPSGGGFHGGGSHVSSGGSHGGGSHR